MNSEHIVFNNFILLSSHCSTCPLQLVKILNIKYRMYK